MTENVTLPQGKFWMLLLVHELNLHECKGLVYLDLPDLMARLFLAHSRATEVFCTRLQVDNAYKNYCSLIGFE